MKIARQISITDLQQPEVSHIDPGLELLLSELDDLVRLQWNKLDLEELTETEDFCELLLAIKLLFPEFNLSSTFTSIDMFNMLQHFPTEGAMAILPYINSIYNVDYQTTDTSGRYIELINEMQTSYRNSPLRPMFTLARLQRQYFLFLIALPDIAREYFREHYNQLYDMSLEIMTYLGDVFRDRLVRATRLMQIKIIMGDKFEELPFAQLHKSNIEAHAEESLSKQNWHEYLIFRAAMQVLNSKSINLAPGNIKLTPQNPIQPALSAPIAQQLIF